MRSCGTAFGLCGAEAEAEVPNSDSISESKDLEEEEGVMRILRFLAECERDTRRDVGRRARSDRLLCWRSAESLWSSAAGVFGGETTEAAAGAARAGGPRAGGRRSCNETSEGGRRGEWAGGGALAGERRRRASSDQSCNWRACSLARSASDVGRRDRSSRSESMSESEQSNDTGVEASVK